MTRIAGLDKSAANRQEDGPWLSFQRCLWISPIVLTAHAGCRDRGSGIRKERDVSRKAPAVIAILGISFYDPVFAVFVCLGRLGRQATAGP